MQVFLDDQPMACSGTLPAHALEAARVLAANLQRLITDARIDGQPWDGDVDALAAARPAGVVAFSSVIINELVGGVWNDLAALTTTISTSQQDAATLLQSGDVPGAMEHLETALGGWQTLQQGFESACAVLGTEPSELLGQSNLLGDLVSQLQLVRDAINGQDWPALSDYLLDEMTELTARWREMLLQLARTLTA